MDPNIYKTPQSDLETEDKDPVSLIKAIGLGLLTDLGGTLIASIAVGVMWVSRNTDSDPEQLNRILMTPGSDPFNAMLVLGLGMTVLGGYVCASVARRRNFVAPAIQGLILLAFGAMGSHSTPVGMLLLMNIGTVLAVMGGAWLRIRRIRPRTSPPA